MELSQLYFRQLVLAVEYLHHHRVIHRDIKPSNMLVYSKRLIKLGDFGVSHIFEGQDDTVNETVRGAAPPRPHVLRA